MDTMTRLFDLWHVPDSDDWYTPPWVFEGLGLRFDLDVASPPGGLDWIPADRFYDENDDGLAQPWHGLVWCNPPYSSPAAWCDKWSGHARGLILVRADLSSAGQHQAFRAAHGIWVPEGRLQFVHAVRGEMDGSSFSAVMLGRGQVALQGMRRLTDSHGGTFRRLER